MRAIAKRSPFVRGRYLQCVAWGYSEQCLRNEERKVHISTKTKSSSQPNNYWRSGYAHFFFFRQKKIDQNETVNDWRLYEDPYGDPKFNPTKYSDSVMTLRLMKIDGNVMVTHLFHQDLRLNATGYTEALEITIKVWIDRVCNGRPCVLQKL